MKNWLPFTLFFDGNGRTAMLLMNLILLQHGFLIANIKRDSKSRFNYYTFLEKVQTENNKTDFYALFQNMKLNVLDDIYIIAGSFLLPCKKRLFCSNNLTFLANTIDYFCTYF
jgi:hypothetical protein